MLSLAIDLPRIDTGPFLFGDVPVGKRTGADWFATGAREKQRPPDGDWRYWLMLAGRGWGKTRTIVEWAKQQAHAMPGSYGAIVAATAADARDVLVEGESGFLNTSTDISYNPSKAQLQWDNGTIALIRSAEVPRRLRGLNSHWAIADELAAWQYSESWDMLMFGLRLGTNPRCAIATTPRPIPIIRALMKDEHCHVTRGSSYENRENLAPAFFDAIIKKYEGTRLGRQELEAEILDDVPGALWTRDTLEQNRVREAPDLYRIVVAIDPAVTANDESDETGVIVAGLDERNHGYTLEDATLRGSPAEWARKAINAYHRWHADAIIAEANQGGDMVRYTLQTIDDSVPVKLVRASKGKHTRAEPVSSLYEKGSIHHVGMFAELEDQMCTWVPGEDSPDRMDALVWAYTELLVGSMSPLGMVDFVELA